MALIPCKECNKTVSDRAAACPHCGAPVGQRSEIPISAKVKKRGWWKWVLGLPLGIFGLLILIGLSVEGGEERRTVRDAIDLCWQDQQRKSNAPDIARFIAGACEKMENDFRNKYGVNP